MWFGPSPAAGPSDKFGSNVKRRWNIYCLDGTFLVQKVWSDNVI